MKEFIMLNIFICAVVSDLWDYKIRNPIIITGWVTGVFINTVTYGIYGMAYTVFCIIITIITGFPVFMAGGIGAGDIKLLSVIGGIHGLYFLAKVVVLFLVIAGAFSFVELIRKRALVSRIKTFIYYILHTKAEDCRYYYKERCGGGFTICLAPIIAAAYFITLFF